MFDLEPDGLLELLLAEEAAAVDEADDEELPDEDDLYC